MEVESARETEDTIGLLSARIALAQAYGALSLLSTQANEPERALAEARRSLFYAQQAQAPEALFRSQWRMAKLQAAISEADPRPMFRSAAASLGLARSAAISRPNKDPLAEPESKGFYLDYLNALIEAARASSGEEEVRRAELRAVIESFRDSELTQYFGGICRRGTSFVCWRDLQPNEALVYPVVFEDRIEALIATAGGRLQLGPSVEIPRPKLIERVDGLRYFLEKSTTNQYRPLAAELYGLLIAPWVGLLPASVDTLIFVPDDALRPIPMAALLAPDGKFLIERYAVAMTPRLDATQAGGGAADPRVLAIGLTHPAELPPLPFVELELDAIRSFVGRRTMIRSDASAPGHRRFHTLDGATKHQPFSVLHLATHAAFGADARTEVFLDTGGKALTVDEFGQVLEAVSQRGDPIELLVLSACETARGPLDERSALAALGLAGVAVRSGAKSALATMWSLDDRAAMVFVGSFYRAWRSADRPSKAQAVRQARRALIEHGDDYSHPSYWAPFLLIGNWR